MTPPTDLPRIEDCRSDLAAAAIAASAAAYTRAVATLAYLSAFPSFLHLRQLTEYLAGRRMLAPDEARLGGWFLMRALSTPEVTTVAAARGHPGDGDGGVRQRGGDVLLRLPRS
jgi:hypothetical protein